MKKNTLRHSLLLLLTAAIWGFAFVAQSVGMDYVQPFTFTAARSLIGGIVLLPFIFIRAQKTGRTSEEKSASWKQALPGGIICGVLLCIASNLQQIGIQYTTVGKSGFITAMYIVLVPVLGIFFHKKTGVCTGRIIRSSPGQGPPELPCIRTGGSLRQMLREFLQRLHASSSRI